LTTFFDGDEAFFDAFAAGFFAAGFFAAGFAAAGAAAVAAVVVAAAAAGAAGADFLAGAARFFVGDDFFAALVLFFADGAFVDAFVFGLASRFFLPAAAFDGDAERDLLVEPVAVDDDDFFAFVEAPLAADFFFFGLAVFFATLDPEALFFVADADDFFLFTPTSCCCS